MLGDVSLHGFPSALIMTLTMSAAGINAREFDSPAEVLRGLDDALGILADMVVRPAFDADELERVKDERRGRILQRSDRPSALADDAFVRVVYGPDHPYGVPLMGTLQTLEALDRDDVEGFHRARYAPGQGTLVVVGDVTREELDGLLAAAFQGWSGQGVDAVPPPPPSRAPRRAIYLVDKPGAAQSEIRVGRLAVSRDTDAYFPLSVANTILGGSFTSRLNTRLREDKGYSYGAGSYFDMRRAPGPFEASSAVATPVTDSSVVEFVRELERMGSEEVPSAELDRARNYLALRLPQRFESVQDVAGRLAELALHDVPLDFYEGYVDGVLDVDASDVRDVSIRYLDPGGMVIVIAGDRSVIEAPLKALGLAPVVPLSDDPISP